eukprot:TRINITY_DN12954_c0_g1_i1.p1 TRINITY_DN12954_c0_g1~~TRINITY_DN12954_c0_g1_i1.p1  ORF type:complete len:281 (-),score=58.16 TRINITY_DN12954_c0_g1_i1:53-895(-)
MYREIARRIRSARSVYVLTGAGISAPSSIPTFRGKGGLWTEMDAQGTDPTITLTKRMFDIDPTVLWNWLIDFRAVVEKTRPNAAHYAILRLQEHCKRIGKEFTLVTQNIDNFHPQLIKESPLLRPNKKFREGENEFGFTEGVLEIHGNEDYIRCSDECNLKLFNYPKGLRKDEVPKCPKCGAPMRPHVLLFDEIYRQDLYALDTAYSKAAGSDCMLVVGSELATNLPSMLVYGHIQAERFLVEVNTKRVIEEEMENVKNVDESCEVSLPKLVEEVINPKV